MDGIIYRFSVNASFCFDIRGVDNEKQAMAKAKLYLRDEIPECLEIGGKHHIAVYPGNENEGLRVESKWDEVEVVEEVDDGC